MNFGTYPDDAFVKFELGLEYLDEDDAAANEEEAAASEEVGLALPLLRAVSDAGAPWSGGGVTTLDRPRPADVDEGVGAS